MGVSWNNPFEAIKGIDLTAQPRDDGFDRWLADRYQLGKGRRMTTPRNEEGSDKGAPELNDLVPDLDPEEYRDPLGGDSSE